ncbi:Nn.00g103020.m01.CDS01 [Neocucurbitaria sp. VM-36]
MSTQHDPALSTHPLHVARQAALIGGASAIPGTVIGAFYGTLRTQTPVLFSIVSGAQWFAIGSTFWGVRTSILNHTGLLNWWNLTRGAPIHPRNDLNPTLSDKVRASTIAGAFTGFSLGLLFRGPRNVVPGSIMFSLFGWAGQHGYNYLDAKNSSELREQAQLQANGEDTPKATLMHKFAKSKWSPMSVLSDEEYIEIMQEKLLKVEAEIAIIDDRIEGFRKKAKERELHAKAKEVQEQVSGNK